MAKKPIYEYEFKAEIKGKRETIQQSATTQKDAKQRIKSKIPKVKIIKQTKKFSYPHLEGGKKI